MQTDKIIKKIIKAELVTDKNKEWLKEEKYRYVDNLKELVEKWMELEDIKKNSFGFNELISTLISKHTDLEDLINNDKDFQEVIFKYLLGYIDKKDVIKAFGVLKDITIDEEE